MTLKRNEGLLRAATKIHQSGDIPANTYVIDLDSLEKNVQALSKKAKDNGLHLYYMTKQIGRSGFVGNIIEKNGILKAVAVDIDEAIALNQNDCRIGNIGHLVQPSKSQWPYVLKNLRPEVVTLYSFERAEQLSNAAIKLGMKQEVILRVTSLTDIVHPGQFGGFQIENLENEMTRLIELRGIKMVGITNFPVLQINEQKNDYDFTPNLETIKKAEGILTRSGIEVKQINAPSATSCYTIPLLKEQGVTHGEPGHAITGTTPLHAVNPDLEEVPCITYVSEISHMDDHHAYTIAGGFYPRSNMLKALFGANENEIVHQVTNVDDESIGHIDYYGSLQRAANMEVGNTVLYAFRTQVFVTRAHVAYVRNVNSTNPELVHFQRRGV